jgi:hypothetical protein
VGWVGALGIALAGGALTAGRATETGGWETLPAAMGAGLPATTGRVGTTGLAACGWATWGAGGR